MIKQINKKTCHWQLFCTLWQIGKPEVRYHEPLASIISVARAILKNASILIMDEATASLDVENETLIQTALSRLIKNKTVLVIAHRMRTVAGANKIIVLADGTIAEEGTPEELMNQNGLFARMSAIQTESDEWAIF